MPTNTQRRYTFVMSFPNSSTDKNLVISSCRQYLHFCYTQPRRRRCTRSRSAPARYESQPAVSTEEKREIKMYLRSFMRRSQEISLTTQVASPPVVQAQTWPSTAPPEAEPLTPRSDSVESGSEVTTFMVSGLLYMHTAQDLKNLVDEMGFAGQHDLCYVPEAKGKRKRNERPNRGYGFINFRCSEYAASFEQAFQHISDMHEEWKPSRVRPATFQGYETNYQRYLTSGGSIWSLHME